MSGGILHTRNKKPVQWIIITVQRHAHIIRRCGRGILSSQWQPVTLHCELSLFDNIRMCKVHVLCVDLFKSLIAGRWASVHLVTWYHWPWPGAGPPQQEVHHSARHREAAIREYFRQHVTFKGIYLILSTLNLTSLDTTFFFWSHLRSWRPDPR